MPLVVGTQDELDERRFKSLFDLAGPVVAVDLADRLRDDLTDIAAGLEQAMARRDCGVLRAKSHILLAIAGTVGATRLHLLAERLNQGARAADLAGCREIVCDIQGLVQRLMERIIEMRVTGKPQ